MNMENESNDRPRRDVAQQNMEQQNNFNLKLLGDTFICRSKIHWFQIPPVLRSTDKTIATVKKSIRKWVKENIPILPEVYEADVT